MNAILHTLQAQLNKRAESGLLRQLLIPRPGMIDFCSNDYLGLAQRQHASSDKAFPAGSGGSRLISGNSRLHVDAEHFIAAYHGFEAALIYNSGYTANIGLLSALAGKNDVILYDELSHASIKDGARLSLAQRFSFKHNDAADLELKLQKTADDTKNIFVVTESVFSMDGDSPDLPQLAKLCAQYKAGLIVDEAHSIGIMGRKGEGMVAKLGLQKEVLAVVYTYGKAPGTHGAAVAGSAPLREYLINFSRPFIYTTSLPAHTIQALLNAYPLLEKAIPEREKLAHNIRLFKQLISGNETVSNTNGPIQAFMTPGNESALHAARELQTAGFDVRAILSPTVSKGSERLRIIMHSFNTVEEIKSLCSTLKNLQFKNNQA